MFFFTLIFHPGIVSVPVIRFHIGWLISGMVHWFYCPVRWDSRNGSNYNLLISSPAGHSRAGAPVCSFAGWAPRLLTRWPPGGVRGASPAQAGTCGRNYWASAYAQRRLNIRRHIVYQSGRSKSHSHEQCSKGPVVLNSFQYLVIQAVWLSPIL